jgi:hypothetical protein
MVWAQPKCTHAQLTNAQTPLLSVSSSPVRNHAAAAAVACLFLRPTPAMPGAAVCRHSSALLSSIDSPLAPPLYAFACAPAATLARGWLGRRRPLPAPAPWLLPFVDLAASTFFLDHHPNSLSTWSCSATRRSPRWCDAAAASWDGGGLSVWTPRSN